MGANSTQALGVALFLVAFVVLAAAMAMGGNPALLAISMTILAVSAGVLLRAKSWEEVER